MPRWGRRQSSYQMESVVTIPASYLNTTIFIGKPNFIYSVSHLVPRISLCGGCDRDGDAGKCRIPKERYENFFLSISPEPKKGIRHHYFKQRSVKEDRRCPLRCQRCYVYIIVNRKKFCRTAKNNSFNQCRSTMVERAGRSVVDRSLGMGEAAGSIPAQSTRF